MSGVRVAFATAQISTTTSLRTLLQFLAASNHRALLKELNISFEGVVATDAPIQVRLLRQSTAGTMSALTMSKVNSSDPETIQTTAAHSATGTEPTAADLLRSWFIHPQAGRTFPLALIGGGMPIKGGERLGLDVLAGVAVDCLLSGELEE